GRAGRRHDRASDVGAAAGQPGRDGPRRGPREGPEDTRRSVAPGRRRVVQSGGCRAFPGGAAFPAMKSAHGNAYNLFILVLTVFSLATMGLLLLPFLSQPTRDLLNLYDNVCCVIFLGDFALSLARTRPRRQYFIYERGWLDLLGSIPNFGISQYAVLLRLARLSRLARITRLLSGQNRKELIRDVLDNRGQYAAF